MRTFICPHCKEAHPENAKFCSATGQPLPAPVLTERVRPLSDEKGAYDLLREALLLYRANWQTFLASAAVLFVPASLLLASAGPLGPWLVTRALTALILYGLVLPLTQGALTLGAADRILNGGASWRDHWMWLLRRLPVLVTAVVPAALLIAVGMLLAIVPGLVFAYFFVFVAPVALFEGQGGTAALKRSFELVRGDWLRTAVVLLAFGLANALVQWLAALLFGERFFGRLVGHLLVLVVMPVPIIASLLLYLDLRRKRDGFDEAQLRAQLDGLSASD